MRALRRRLEREEGADEIRRYAGKLFGALHEIVRLAVRHAIQACDVREQHAQRSDGVRDHFSGVVDMARRLKPALSQMHELRFRLDLACAAEIGSRDFGLAERTAA